MLKTNLKIAWRSIWKHKAYSLINIIGLTTGLTACLIVAAVVIDELSYDKQWAKADDIYRVISLNTSVKGEERMAVTFSGLGPSLKKDFPEVSDYCRISVYKDRIRLGEAREGVKLESIHAEPTLWNVLDFNVIQGNPQKFVKGYTNLIITKKIQQQYFPNQSPVGKVVYTVPDYGEKKACIITGVVDQLPQNTHLRADIITLSEFPTGYNEMPKPNGVFTFTPQYILLKHGTSVAAFNAKVNNWYKAAVVPKKADYLFQFQPMKDVYLKSDFGGGQTVQGSMQNVYIFSAVAVFLLLIACINFVNLTISRVFTRAKETGVRKVLGAGTGQLMMRFLSESVLFFLMSFALAIVLYQFLIKPVESYLGHSLTVSLYNSAFLLATVIIVLVVSIGTGLYPAWYLSRPQPSVILRGKSSGHIQLNFLKKALVVGQFAISVAIILVTIIVHNQLDFMGTKDLGFDKSNLINIAYTDWGKTGQVFKQGVKQLPGVKNASITNWYPTAGAGNMSTTIELKGEKVNVFFIQADADLGDVLKLKLSSGRLLDANTPTDVMDADSVMGGTSKQTKDKAAVQPLIITSYTAALLNAKLNAPVSFKGMPVGVVKDFYSESLRTKIKPTLIMGLSNPSYGYMLVRVIPGTEKQVLTAMNKLYKQLYPDKPFDYSWVSDQVDEQYKAEFKLQQLFSCFSVLIIFLACLGLFGLVSFTVEQRIKEIGIRKVLGAGVSSIVTLIAKDYLWLIIVAVIIASPLAWYAMNKWLQDFAYHITIQWWVFALAGGSAALIAFLTISMQSIKAALVNPVKSLKSE
ncbi:ABC transporter permease [Mucilaginibacter psychrotolerans]|uniref:ABC transporter permease n=1 Tax=Mucilaginibacter psychrotolerans TaxID=1524096 RepID=A0A4Y8SK01_9SPHI|nr:ABC transporter permease [Mucilaginibacter psychrotolerans]TFF39212.1 ABC transporter permease [Mucilaginibacter psychrotolerans]